MRAERERELVAAAGEQVHDAAREVGDREHLAEVQARERPALRADRHDGVARGERGRDRADEAEQLGLLGRDDADDAGRLGRREGQERRRDGVHAAQHRVQLVGPARVVHEHVDRGRDLVAGGGRLGAAQVDGLLGELRAARLERLGRAVEHLPAVVGGLARPARLRAARLLDGVADVLARGAGDVGHVAPLVVEHRVVPAGLRARERAADVELVGLADGEARAHETRT